MTELVPALQNIRSNFVRDDYVSRVKAVMQDHLQFLEPDALVEDTHYFNHSAIPDFKLTWGRGRNEKAHRDVYLRSTYASVVASDDAGHIREGDPVFLALDAEQNVNEPGFVMTRENVSQATSNTTHTLLTDAAALDEISVPLSQDSNPMTSVIRSNFLRGARGLVDEPVVEALVQASAPAQGGSVSELIRQSFFEDAVFRMERTALLVQWALDPSQWEATDANPLLDGAMSTEELRSILPWLLAQETLPVDGAFWGSLGGLFAFEQLEELATELEGVDISALVRANLSTWSVRRGYLGLNIQEVEQEANASKWAFSSGTLGFARGAQMIRVSNSGAKLKTRPGSHRPRWDAVRPSLADFSLRSVSLSGIERSLRVVANQSENLNPDVNTLVETVADDYFVDKVEISLPVVAADDVEDGTVQVELDFAGSIAVSPSPVQLGAIVQAVSNVLGHNSLDSDLNVRTESAVEETQSAEGGNT
jgi:hypothetical protein